MLSAIETTLVVVAGSYGKAVKEAVRRARMVHGLPKSSVVEVVAERREKGVYAVTVVMDTS